MLRAGRDGANARVLQCADGLRLGAVARVAEAKLAVLIELFER